VWLRVQPGVHLSAGGYCVLAAEVGER
jgi:hypothetical protein